jgi:hypothetical protein
MNGGPQAILEMAFLVLGSAMSWIVIAGRVRHVWSLLARVSRSDVGRA